MPVSNHLDRHLRAYQGGNLYDFDNLIQLKWYPARVIELSPGASSLLELGLGHGITTDLFGKHFRRHVVIDASPAVIGHFRQRFPDSRAEIVESYFESFGTGERFDVIVLGYVLEHVDDPRAILNRYRAFLAPGGRMFVAVPNAEGLNRRLGVLAGMLPDLEQLSEHDLLLGHKRYYSVASLRRDIESCGYDIRRIEGIYLKPLSTAQMVSLELDERIVRALCQVAVGYPELSCSILAELALPR